MSETLRVGIVGAGFVAGFHARALEHVRGVELAGIFALKGAEELAARAKNLGVGEPVVFGSIGEMAKAVDAVAICAPNFAHLSVMEEVATAKQAGAGLMGVICEKPLARNLGEASKMVQLAEAAGLRTAYLENQCYMPDILALKQQLTAIEAAMGPVHLATSAEEHGGPHEPWFWDPTQQGGGVLLDMGCHSVKEVMFMLTPAGKPSMFLQPTAVSCETRLIKWGREPWLSELKARGVDYTVTPAEDFTLGTVVFQNPETGQIVYGVFRDSWMFDKLALRLSMEALGAGYAYDVNTLVSPGQLFIGDKAAASIISAEAAAEKAQSSRGLMTVLGDEPATYGYRGEWVDLRDHFLAGEDASLTFRDGEQVVLILMAAYRSAELGQRVDLTDSATTTALQTYVPLIQQGKGASVLL